MKITRGIAYALFSLLLLASCSQGVGEDESPKETDITIKPHTLNEEEKKLISKTGVQYIEYFLMDGKLKESDDLIYKLEIYENGKLLNEGMGSHGELKTQFDDELISFGIQDSGTEVKSSKILMGQPDGIASTVKEHNMTMSGFSRLIEKEVTLEKDKPVYLAAWAGTTQNSLRTIGSDNGELPEAVNDAELAFVYMIMLVDEEK